MDRNSIIGFVLISILVIVYFVFNREQLESQQEQQKAIQDSIAHAKHVTDSIYAINHPDTTTYQEAENTNNVVTRIDNDSLLALRMKKEYGPFANAIQGDEQLYTLENDKIKVTFSNRGGKIYTAEVKGYKTFEGNPLVLLDGAHTEFSIGIPTGQRFIETDSLIFTTPDESASLKEEGDSASIIFRLPAGEGRYIEHRYSLTNESNFVRYQLRLVGMNDLIPSRDSRLTLKWAAQLNLAERTYDHERGYTTVYYQTAEDKEVDYISENKDVLDETVKVPIRWISFKQQFFNSTLITDQQFTSGSITTQTPEDQSYLKELSTKVYLDYSGGEEQTYDMKFYFGPNGFYNLKHLGYGMEEMVPMGGFGLGFINKYIILPVFDFFSRFIGSYGIIILLLAIFIKLILTPLTWKSFKSMASMRVLKPDIEEIKKKYKDDMQKTQMETMKLYRKTGVSMMGGCLPMLLQMPILIAMYRFFPNSIYLRQESFLWAQDLSTYDSIIDLGTKIPFYGDHVSLFTILMAITSFFYTRMNQQMTPTAGAGAGQMKFIQYFMPFFLIFIFNGLSSGLTYYYLLYNLLSFAQQFLFQRYFIDEDAIRRKIEERKKKPVKKSKWQERLEKMQKVQEQQKRQRGKR